jgi:hypothetical protein
MRSWVRARAAGFLAVVLFVSVFCGVSVLCGEFVLPGAPRAEPVPERDASSRPAPTAKPLLWKIERQPTSYLYGTIHVSDPRVLALPAAVQGALERSEVVYTEIPLDPATQQRVQLALALPQGETLKAALPGEIYARAERFLSARGVAIELFQGQKVWVLATLLPMLDYVGRGRPLDEELYTWAQRRGKRTAGIETVEMQVAAMESAGREGEVALLRETLAHLELAAAQKRDPMGELIELYLAGDEDKIAAASFAYVDRGDAVLRRVLDALIDQRNDYMAGAIAERLQAEPGGAHFFAVGAMHLPGQRGVVAQLRSRGLRVTRVP